VTDALRLDLGHGPHDKYHERTTVYGSVSMPALFAVGRICRAACADRPASRSVPQNVDCPGRRRRFVASRRLSASPAVLHRHGPDRPSAARSPDRRLPSRCSGNSTGVTVQKQTEDLLCAGFSPTRPTGGNPLPSRPLGRLPTPRGHRRPPLRMPCGHPGRHGDADLRGL
jgi:hypothetical protein